MQASRQAMAEMVHHIFSRLDSIPEPLDSPFAPAASAALHTTSRLQVSPVGAAAARAGAEDDAGPGDGEAAAADGEAAVAVAAAGAEAREGSPLLEDAAASGQQGAAAAPAAAAAAAEEDSDAAEDAAPPPAPLQSPGGGEILSLLPGLNTHHAEEEEEAEGYGIEAVREVLLFIISLIGSGGRCRCIALWSALPVAVHQLIVSGVASLGPHAAVSGLPWGVDDGCQPPCLSSCRAAAAVPVGAHQDLPAHGLDLMNTALQAAGPALEQHESLMVLLQQDLVRAMFAAARQPSLACLAGVCQVALGLYVNLRSHMLLQVEALLSLLLLPLAEGRGGGGGASGHQASALELQQAALEGVLDFCSQPDFVRDIYLNLDCRCVTG